VRARAASGRPYTAVLDRYLDSKSGTMQPVFAQHNAARMQAFFQLDLHVEKRLDFDAVQLAFMLDVWNVTNQVNLEQVAYSSDYSERRDVRGLPLLALVGAEVRL
jgi:hypothetical protein